MRPPLRLRLSSGQAAALEAHYRQTLIPVERGRARWSCCRTKGWCLQRLPASCGLTRRRSVKPSTGATAKGCAACGIDPAWERLLPRLIDQDPRQVGVQRTTWTTSALAEYLTEQTDIQVSEDTVRRGAQGQPAPSGKSVRRGRDGVSVAAHADPLLFGRGGAISGRPRRPGPTRSGISLPPPIGGAARSCAGTPIIGTVAPSAPSVGAYTRGYHGSAQLLGHPSWSLRRRDPHIHLDHGRPHGLGAPPDRAEVDLQDNRGAQGFVRLNALVSLSPGPISSITRAIL